MTDDTLSRRALAKARADVTLSALAWGRKLVEGTDTKEDAAAFDDAVERLEHAVEAALRLPAGADWQPIETAPKDGRKLILLLTPSNWPQIAYSNTWWTAGFSVECKPTHWAPIPQSLPAAPRNETGEG